MKSSELTRVNGEVTRVNSLDQETKDIIRGMREDLEKIEKLIVKKKIEVGAVARLRRRKYGWDCAIGNAMSFHGQWKGGFVEEESVLQH